MLGVLGGEMSGGRESRRWGGGREWGGAGGGERGGRGIGGGVRGGSVGERLGGMGAIEEFCVKVILPWCLGTVLGLVGWGA